VALSSYSSKESSTTFKTLEDFAQKRGKDWKKEKLTWLLRETLKLIMFQCWLVLGIWKIKIKISVVVRQL
jgi:hypothetical protein